MMELPWQRTRKPAEAPFRLDQRPHKIERSRITRCSGPSGNRTRDLRIKRPLEGVTSVDNASQGVGTIRGGDAGGVQTSHPLPALTSPFATQVLQGSARGVRRLRVLDGGRGRLLTVKDAAAVLGVCTRVVYQLVDRGELSHFRISNAIRIAPADLAAFMKARQKRGAR